MAVQSTKAATKVRARDIFLAFALVGGVGYGLSSERPEFFIGWAIGIGVYLFVVVLAAIGDWEARTKNRRPDGMPPPGPPEYLAGGQVPMLGSPGPSRTIDVGAMAVPAADLPMGG